MIRTLAALLLLAGLAACSPKAEDAAAVTLTPPPPTTTPIDVASFTPQQQTDLRAVVRDYLVRDPTVLREALNVLAAQERATRAHTMANDPAAFSIGPADAPVTVVEFFDYRCPYCHLSYHWAFDVVQRRRDVRVVFKEYPIIAPESELAARAAIASIKQGRYAPFHQALMRHTGPLNDEIINQIAQQSGVDVARMRRDMQTDEAAITAILVRNLQQGNEEGVTGTPAFMINGEWIRGWPRGGDAELDAKVEEAARKARERT